MPHSKLQLRDLTDQSEQHLIQQVQNSKLHHLFVWKDGFRLALFSNLSKQITSRSESNSREVRNQHLAKPAGSHGHSFVTESPGSQIQGHSRQVFLLNRRYTALLLMIQFQSPLGGQSSIYLSGQPTQFSYHVFVSLTSIELQIRDPFNIIPFNHLQNFQLRMAHHVKLGFHSESSVAKVEHAQECACIVVLNESVHGTKSFPRTMFVKP